MSGEKDRKEINDEILDKYFDVTGRAMAKIKIGKELKFDWEEKARDFLDMAKCYYKDAEFFRQQGDFVNAFGAVYYAHGWLDAGARLGLFDVDGDNVLFTVDKEMFEEDKKSLNNSVIEDAKVGNAVPKISDLGARAKLTEEASVEVEEEADDACDDDLGDEIPFDEDEKKTDSVKTESCSGFDADFEDEFDSDGEEE